MKKQLHFFGLLVVIACCSGFSQTQKALRLHPRNIISLFHNSFNQNLSIFTTPFSNWFFLLH
jgi:Na+/phosphate symporter